MFEITRRQNQDPVRDLFHLIAGDNFFRTPSTLLEEEGNLAVDVSESNGDILVRANLPGYKKEDIDVQIHKGVLSISAEHTEEEESKNERFFRKERRYGCVTRRIALPGIIEESKVNADLKDGVLVLTIPQSEAAKPHKVMIQ